MRPIPDTCDYLGNAEKTHARPCTLTPRRAVSVGGLSSLYVCDSHGKVLNRQWGAFHTVQNQPITSTGHAKAAAI